MRWDKKSQLRTLVSILLVVAIFSYLFVVAEDGSETVIFDLNMSLEGDKSLTSLSLQLDKATIEIGENVLLRANLTYQGEIPLSGHPINFYLNQTELIGYNFTDENGLAELLWNSSSSSSGLRLRAGKLYKVISMSPSSLISERRSAVKFRLNFSEGR